MRDSTCLRCWAMTSFTALSGTVMLSRCAAWLMSISAIMLFRTFILSSGELGWPLWRKRVSIWL